MTATRSIRSSRHRRADHRRPQRVRDGTAVQVLDTTLVAARRAETGVNIVEMATRRRVTVGMVTLTFVLFGLIMTGSR